MRSKRNPSVLIGVAGWTIPARFKGSFPGNGTHLQRYARTLNAVEINTSFKQSHSRATYERWAKSGPREFRFSVKVPHAFTHESELRPSKAALDALSTRSPVSHEIVYFRLHGSPRRYYSDYTDEQLQLIRARIDAACQESKQVWCIFDNTALGCATGNALELSRLREE
jgi:uncharacterized protein YecE (DUF72 family)